MPIGNKLAIVLSWGCAADGTGFVELTSIVDPQQGGPYVFLLSGNATGFAQQYAVRQDDLPFQVDKLPNDTFAASLVDTFSGNQAPAKQFAISCTGGAVDGTPLTLDSLSHTDETAALNDGTATIQAHGGVAPLTADLVELSLSQPATSGQPNVFTKLAPLRYTLRVTDSSTPTPQVVSGQVTVEPYAEPVAGCQDEYATNYDPAATSSGSCEYAPNWRSAWGRGNMPVVVAAETTDTKSFLTALLRVGFREGHPLHDLRPLSAAITVRATIAPDGYATFHLGPFLRPLLGAADGLGGYRLDLNSDTAVSDDFYVGYELRRVTGEMLEHGYALNTAVPDEQLVEDRRLTPFAPLLPIWPGFDDYRIAFLANYNMGKFGELLDEAAMWFDTYRMPCPSNPLPVAWLAPEGFGFWVFQGRPQLGDDVSDGQTYTEPSSGERRYSDPGEARQTVKASSGAFAGNDLLRGLRTLWRSPQVWYQPDPEGEWIAVVVERGQRDVGRMGVRRQELQISFTHAAPEVAQGQ
jgi:hypothetical protein